MGLLDGKRFSLVFACISMIATLPGFASDGTSATAQGSGNVSQQARDTSITIYNQNFGLVRDVREVNLKEGINQLTLDDVAAAIDPTTVSFTSLTAPNSVVCREQVYKYDLMDQDTILIRSVGREVTFRQRLQNGSERILKGTLLSGPAVMVADSNGNIMERRQDVVIRTPSGVVVAPQGELELVELPSGLIAKPCLGWKVECNKPGGHQAEISYQTQGLNWKCDYVAVDSADDSAVNLTSWVTLDNKSGATYHDAALKLLAGDVHKIVDQIYADERMEMAQDAVATTTAAPQFTEQSFAEYHLYSLAGKVDLHDNETKQMTLFEANAVPVKKLYIYEPGGHNAPIGGTEDSKVTTKIELENSKTNNMGMALPKGTVRVYKKDKDDALQFIGEDSIDHTPKDEKVRLELGNAFDLWGNLNMTDLHIVNKDYRSGSYELTLRNHKDVPVTITFVGHAYGEWKMVSSSIKSTKKDSSTFEIEVPVEKNGETKVKYTVESTAL